jgi:triosephosphate isomerase
MHLNAAQASLLLHRLQEQIDIHRDIEVVLAPSLLTLQPLSVQLDRRKFRLAAQNAYFKDEGAYTGEVSFTMLRELVHYALVGHSERRRVFHEDLDMVRDKVAAAVRNEIVPVLCVGETKQERDEGETKQVLHDQLMSGLSNLTAKDLRVLYGGGIVPEATHGFLNIEGVDGFLVGHESINYHDFAEIVQSAYRWQRQKGE